MKTFSTMTAPSRGVTTNDRACSRHVPAMTWCRACAGRFCRGLSGAAILGVALGLPPAGRPVRADEDDAPRPAVNDEVMRRLDRISAGLERLLDRMGPPEGPRGRMGPPEGERRDGEPERRPEIGRPDGPPRGRGPRPPWDAPGMPDGVRRMEEARERWESMERRIRQLEEEVEKLKKARREQ